MSTITEKELLDWGVRIGSQARLAGVEKHQLENLIASLDSVDDPRACLLMTAVFAYRQASRDVIGPSTAVVIRSAMSELYNKSDKPREAARKMLGFAKWVYESTEGIKNLEILRSDPKTRETLEGFVEFLARVSKK